MATAGAQNFNTEFSRNCLLAALIIAGWVVLYAPVYLQFLDTAWAREENGHVPFVMAIAIGAAWSRLQLGGFTPAPMREFRFGVVGLMIGLALFAIGRIGEIDLFLSASQSAIAASLVLSLFGVDGVKRLWFPLLLTAYLIILPGWALDAATAPLKRFVSIVVSETLYLFGAPVAHSGAVISAGPYQLLVADACAGLNSIVALTSVGAVYLYVVKRQSIKTNIAVIAALLPLAIIANLIRVAMLVLITLYLGYDAGQSFLHDLAGLVMFAIALAGVFLVDAIAARMFEAPP